MAFINKIKTFALIVVFEAIAQSTTAQDLLAKQAPIDRKMKAIDTLLLHSIIEKESTESPAVQLHDEWENRYAYRATALPDSFKIDLRHSHMPTPSRVVTNNFGSRWGRQHKGLDIKVCIGDTIRAAFSGKVRIVRYETRGYGNYIVIRHNNGPETIHGYLSKQLTRENQEVRAGDVTELGGNTGRSTGSHLHFETRLRGVTLNPALLLDFRAQDVTSDFHIFRNSSYQRESSEATHLRGVVRNGRYTPEEVRDELAYKEDDDDMVNPAQAQYHKMIAGETLSSIARKRGVTIEQICRLSHVSKSTKPKPGSILRYS